MRITFGAMVFVAAVSLATAASAQQPRKRATAAPQSTGETGAGPLCQRLCESDLTPCDPPEFKRVDGRCNGANYGNSNVGF